MVYILLIKINFTDNNEGIQFTNFEGRSETSEDDTSINNKKSVENWSISNTMMSIIKFATNYAWLGTINVQS